MNARSRKKTETEQPATTIRWKQRLLAVDEMLDHRAALAHQVAAELVAVYEDPEFLADPAIGGDDNRAIECLDAYAARLFVIPDPARHPFCDLRAMLAMSPDPCQWTAEGLPRLFQSVLEKEQQRQREPAAAPRQTVKLAEFREAQQKIRRLQEEADQARAEAIVLKGRAAELEGLRTELEDARRRIAQLERENARLRKEIGQLQPA